jgi:hypothetical protein
MKPSAGLRRQVLSVPVGVSVLILHWQMLACSTSTHPDSSQVGKTSALNRMHLGEIDPICQSEALSLIDLAAADNKVSSAS